MTTRIRGRISHRVDAGTATVFFVEALEPDPELQLSVEPGAPLVYYNRTWHTLDLGSKITPAR